MGRYTRLFRKASLFRMMMNLWPPMYFQGIHIDFISESYDEIIVSLKNRWFTLGNFDTHWGGSLFSMTDGFHAIIIMNNLGPEYHVWDQEASIRFVKQRRGRVSAHFKIDPEDFSSLLMQTQDYSSQARPSYEVAIKDETGAIVAIVQRQLFVKRRRLLKRKPRPQR